VGKTWKWLNEKQPKHAASIWYRNETSCQTDILFLNYYITKRNLLNSSPPIRDVNKNCTFWCNNTFHFTLYITSCVKCVQGVVQFTVYISSCVKCVQDMFHFTVYISSCVKCVQDVFQYTVYIISCIRCVQDVFQFTVYISSCVRCARLQCLHLMSLGVPLFCTMHVTVSPQHILW
jgi:hypothetical protein